MGILCLSVKGFQFESFGHGGCSANAAAATTDGHLWPFPDSQWRSSTGLVLSCHLTYFLPGILQSLCLLPHWWSLPLQPWEVTCVERASRGQFLLQFLPVALVFFLNPHSKQMSCKQEYMPLHIFECNKLNRPILEKGSKRNGPVFGKGCNFDAGWCRMGLMKVSVVASLKSVWLSRNQLQNYCLHKHTCLPLQLYHISCPL